MLCYDGRWKVLEPRSRQARSTTCDEGCSSFFFIQIHPAFLFLSILFATPRHTSCSSPAGFGVPIRFLLVTLTFPGLTPWAVFCHPFGVRCHVIILCVLTNSPYKGGLQYNATRKHRNPPHNCPASTRRTTRSVRRSLPSGSYSFFNDAPNIHANVW